MFARFSRWLEDLKTQRDAAADVLSRSSQVAPDREHGHAHEHFDGIVHEHGHGHGDHDHRHDHGEDGNSA
jgi:hypothetical protein